LFDSSFSFLMSIDNSPPVWLGAPQRGHSQEDVLDPYTSKIGGKAVCFRVGSTPTERLDAAALCKYFQCPQCKSTAQVSLLCQVYAPLEVYDRVLYLFTCAACARRPATGPTGLPAAPAAAPPPGAGKKSGLAAAAAAKSLTSFCFAVRSQNFSREFYAELQQEQRKAAQQSQEARKAKEEGETPLFDEGDDDWGDGAEDWGDDDISAEVTHPPPLTSPPSQEASSEANACATTPAGVEAERTWAEQVSFPLAPRATIAAVKGTLYTDGLPLDLYVEPKRAKTKELSVEEQLAVAERMYGDNATVDTSGFEEDDETPAEACVREYMEELEANPSQCVRWCPGGAPLRTTLSPIGVSGAADPPPCTACGAPRQFEMQLTAPTVYYLTKDIGEAKNATLHFSNVLVYTCSRHCYATKDNSPYLPEYVVVEDEL
jgi:pre-rRNA-processing protein TSR4